MKEKYVKMLITIIVVSFIGMFIFLNINKENKPLPEVKLKEIVNEEKAFAIMIQNGDGYEEYDSNTWPGDGYIYKEAKCTDNNGAIVDDAITFADGKATLTTNQTVFCTLYFDEKPNPTEDLRAKDLSGNLSTDLQGGMYRYQGTDNVPNWICFGTRNADECKSDPDGIDKYMYRIIGITEEGQMYLIKETFLKEGSGTSFTWNDKYSVDSSSSYYCDNGLCPEWNTSLLFKRINGTSNGTTQGTGTTSDKADTDIFVDSAQYDYLKSGDSNGGGSASEWYNLIANHEWLYGDTNESSAASKYNGDAMYAIEHGDKETTHYVGTKGNITQETYTWSQKVTAKISLMYLHDYYYGYYDGSSEDSRGNAGSYSKLASSWLFFKKDGYNSSPSYEWLSTRWGVASTSYTYVTARSVYNNGDLGTYDRLHYAYGVRPVFYLESSAKISSGEGTKDSPFILA